MQASHTRALPGKNAAIAAASAVLRAWRKTHLGGQRQHPDCSRLHDCRERGKMGVKEREKSEGKGKGTREEEEKWWGVERDRGRG